ncbi:TolC family protein [Uliginosibacterium sp. H3]|uniref:TolC family protein n=1 Tax=Uliginosibacterium silvisoli TaxID=3114758 RepID=A0ABU6JYH8_9RHOO|nr:TolC family protein [Uliginosibacterium sp. H3]
MATDSIMIKRLSLLLIAGAVAACVTKSPPSAVDIQKEAMPHTTVPADWKGRAGGSQPVVDRWLASFNDPVLAALVDEALAYNADIRLAAARVEQAGGYVKVAGAALYPAVNMLAHGGGKMGGDGSGLTGVFVSASLELDVWGRVRYGRNAAQAQYASIEADYAYARQSLAAVVAKSYFLAIESGLQKGVAQDMVKASDELLRLSQERLRVGAGDESAVVDARANSSTFRDTLRQVDYSRDQALRALELLLGRYPSAEVAVAPQLVSVPAPAPLGLPSELLERRPDVVAAERRVAAAFDRVEEAKAARLPRISLTASGSNVSSELFVLKDHDNPVWSLGANLVAPLYQGGALQAQVEIRSSEQKLAVADYARIAQRAFSDVEGALSAEGALRDRDAILVDNVKNVQRALDLSQIQYKVGKADLRTVGQRQLALYAARTSQIHVRSEQLAQRVNLYLALGGSFEASDKAADKTATR